jgi:hypothetical protein
MAFTVLPLRPVSADCKRGLRHFRRGFPGHSRADRGRFSGAPDIAGRGRPRASYRMAAGDVGRRTGRKHALCDRPGATVTQRAGQPTGRARGGDVSRSSRRQVPAGGWIGWAAVTQGFDRCPACPWVRRGPDLRRGSGPHRRHPGLRRIPDPRAAPAGEESSGAAFRIRERRIRKLQASARSVGSSTSLVTRRPAKRLRMASSYLDASGGSATYCAMTCSPNQTRTRRRRCRDATPAMATAGSPRN